MVKYIFHNLFNQTSVNPKIFYPNITSPEYYRTDGDRSPSPVH
ncbi:hypothetical protein [[Phormidium ambiguum] IAM M-71]|nr:hypothetical protein [Phormidium ambiguum]